ncbi:hypothetical protein V6N13_046212 [Hibiscus sabdariffa]
MNTFIWNAQGCGHRNFNRVARQYIQNHSPYLLCFVETRISNATANKVIVALNIPNSFHVEAEGFLGEICGCSFMATFTHASPQSNKRKPLWDYLRALLNVVSEPWIVLRDFNATTPPTDRKGCMCSAKPDSSFISALFYFGLHDLGYEGAKITLWQDNEASEKVLIGVATLIYVILNLVCNLSLKTSLIMRSSSGSRSCDRSGSLLEIKTLHTSIEKLL